MTFRWISVLLFCWNFKVKYITLRYLQLLVPYSILQKLIFAGVTCIGQWGQSTLKTWFYPQPGISWDWWILNMSLIILVIELIWLSNDNDVKCMVTHVNNEDLSYSDSLLMLSFRIWRISCLTINTLCFTLTYYSLLSVIVITVF